MRAQDDEILVVFDFPDGSCQERSFKRGQTVEVLKAFLAAEYEISMEGLGLFLGGRVMMDPLSLSDFPASVKGTFRVTVEVEGGWATESKGK